MNQPKLLYRAIGMLDAKSIQLLLESFQISSRIIQESAGVALGINLGNLGSANIYVDESDFVEADKIITLMESGELELPDNFEPDESSNQPEENDDNGDGLS